MKARLYLQSRCMRVDAAAEAVYQDLTTIFTIIYDAMIRITMWLPKHLAYTPIPPIPRLEESLNLRELV